MGFRIAKLKASTLVETLVAVTIIAMVAGLAMVLFIQVSSPGSSTKHLLLAQQRSAELMSELTHKTLTTQVSSQSLTYANLTFEQQLFRKEQDLFLAQIEVFDNSGRLIYSRKRLIYSDDE